MTSCALQQSLPCPLQSASLRRHLPRPAPSAAAVQPACAAFRCSPDPRAVLRQHPECSSVAAPSSTARPCSSGHSSESLPERFDVRCRARKTDGPIAQRDQAQPRQRPTGDERAAGRDSYRPASFQTLVDDASQAVLVGLEDGLTRMEVELPSVGVDSESSPQTL